MIQKTLSRSVSRGLRHSRLCEREKERASSRRSYFLMSPTPVALDLDPALCRLAYGAGMVAADPRSPTELLASPPRTPQRAHRQLPRPNSPVKLTPLERKERDRQRQKEQAQRRIQAIKDRDAQATALMVDQHKSSAWHRQERQEEELVLRRLERDLVDVERCHPSAAGYRFSPAREAPDAIKSSPVFRGYSPALCPASQVPPYPAKTPASAVTHPAFTGYCVAKHNDVAAISPVFFLVRYSKTPLDQVSITDDDGDAGGSENDSDDDGAAMQTQDQFLAQQRLRDGATAGRIATITKLEPTQQLELQEILRGRLLVDAGTKCLVCRGRSAVGCPGCFVFSHQMYQHVQSLKSTQRLKTPKTHGQETDERHARYTGLRLKLMGYGRRCEDGTVEENSDSVDEERSHESQLRRPVTAEQRLYYVDVLADIHAVRKHRTLRRNYVTLHIKSLPVGNLISLQVDVKASVAYVYELYRSSIDSPNRKIHLLLPTTAGLFYLSELMESATDTRCGLVNGELLVEDFHLYASTPPPASPLPKRNGLRDAVAASRPPEFMLFAVAVLSETATPQLVGNFLQQNFHFDDDESSGASNLRIQVAVTRLPPGGISDDAYQRRLVPHANRMKEFARVAKQIELLEAERERERVLWVAYQERKLARLEQKRRHHRLAQQGNGDGTGHRKRKVTRALAYLDFVLDSTSNPRRARVWEERLEKLWQCAQRFEEWKLCKHGRLVDAENTADTRRLVQRHLEATVTAFDTLLQRTASAGPLAYPIQWIGSSSQPQLVVKIGVRLGCSSSENHEYGLVLDLTQDYEALLAATPLVSEGDRKRMMTRGFTKKQLLARDEAQAEHDKMAASWRCHDCEWRPKLSSETTSSTRHREQSVQLFTGSDLLREPFLRFPWHVVVHAYKHVVASLAFHLAKLDEFNALARILQQEDAQLGKAQIATWTEDVERFHTALLALAETGDSSLVKQSMLVRATQRVLAKKGAALLTKRLRQRRQKMREREAELERLRVLQEDHATAKPSVVERLKVKFIQDTAPKILAVLEPTPAERLLLRAEMLLGAAAAKASRVAQSAKKEYDVRAL